MDLSRIDFDKLRQQFEQPRKRTEIERLRGRLNAKVQAMVALNKARVNYAEKFQQMIDEYNAGSGLVRRSNRANSSSDSPSATPRRSSAFRFWAKRTKRSSGSAI